MKELSRQKSHSELAQGQFLPASKTSFRMSELLSLLTKFISPKLKTFRILRILPPSIETSWFHPGKSFSIHSEDSIQLLSIFFRLLKRFFSLYGRIPSQVRKFLRLPVKQPRGTTDAASQPKHSRLGVGDSPYGQETDCAPGGPYRYSERRPSTVSLAPAVLRTPKTPIKNLKENFATISYTMKNANRRFIGIFIGIVVLPKRTS